jgi:uncharacterized membrane protein
MESRRLLPHRPGWTPGTRWATGTDAVHWMEPWGLILAIGWIAALLFMVWLIVRAPAERRASEDARAILRVRFARGEISLEEFERARRVLLADEGAEP